ncbi:enoyl-CoA hydratase/isomerase family protein [Streptomyces sp. NPDC054951]
MTLAFDLRYASREEAVFSQPEVAIGIVPGGGGSDRLARLLGRDRALEAILTSQDYDAERAEQYGWVTRAVPDAELDDLVNGVAARIASFDKASVLGARARGPCLRPRYRYRYRQWMLPLLRKSRRGSTRVARRSVGCLGRVGGLGVVGRRGPLDAVVGRGPAGQQVQGVPRG